MRQARRSSIREADHIKGLLRPDLMVEHLFDIPLDVLEKNQIRGMIFDLDNTIIAWNGKEMEEDIIHWLRTVQKRGFQLYIVSNSMKNRVRRIAEQLSVPFTARAGKPMRGGFRDALTLFGLDGGSVAVVGDQLFTDVLGGNRIGAFTILVKPLSDREFFTTKLTRIVEKIMLRKRKP